MWKDKVFLKMVSLNGIEWNRCRNFQLKGLIFFGGGFFYTLNIDFKKGMIQGTVQ